MVTGLPDEHGSQIVQAALAVPFILVILFAALQLSFVAVSEASVASQINKACVAVDVSRLSTSNLDAELKSQIAASGSMIDDDALDVSNASISYPAVEVEEADVSGGGIESIEKRAQTVRLKADVTYRIPSMISMLGFDELVIERHIDSVQTVQAKVEVY